MLKINERQIVRYITTLIPGIHEFRALCDDKYRTKESMYFMSDQPADLIEEIKRSRWPDNCNINCYVTVNRCREYCVSRVQYGELRSAREMTQDDDIEWLDFIPIDIDSKHPAGVSATDGEKKEAHGQAREVFAYMKKMGFDNPIIIDSGNGYHLLYPTGGWSNDLEHQRQVAAVIDALHTQFPLVDPATKNPSRIMGLAGTMKMKGRSTDTRPHRWTRILKVPSEEMEVSDRVEQ